MSTQASYPTRTPKPYVDPVIEAYKKDVDRTLILHARRMTVEQRLVSLEQCLNDMAELRRAMIAATKK